MPYIMKIKRINEILPSWLKQLFSGIIRSQLIKNKVFLNQYMLLEKMDTASEYKISMMQQKLLKDLLICAYENSHYYRNIIDECNINPYRADPYDILKNMPTLSKKQLRENLESITNDKVTDFYTVTTGGTTGEPTKVYMERDAIYKEWAFIYHFWSKYGYDYHKSKLATLRGVDMGKKISTVNPLYREVRLNPFRMNSINIHRYVNIMDKYGTDYIYGYPSAVYNFFRLCKSEKIEIKGRFRAAFLISENLYPFQEELIKDVGGCPIAIFYGHSERALFAEQYEEGYVLNKLYGVTNINEDGIPVATGFINAKTPLINYVIDDEFIPNGCGNYEIKGHRDCEVLLGQNGENISMAAINVHDDTFESISGYQFYQDTLGECILYVTSDFSLDAKQIDAISRSVNHKLSGAIKCIVRQTENLIYSSRGKYSMVIQKCSRESEKHG